MEEKYINGVLQRSNYDDVIRDKNKKRDCFNKIKKAHAEFTNLQDQCTMVVKDTNPKDSVGIAKAPLSTVSGTVIMELGVAMLEGARKYGRHNYRVAGVRASVYYDAAFRHLVAWYEGEDADPDSGMSHITKAMASLAVLRDAQIQGKVFDDRPPKSPEGFISDLNKKAKEIIEKYPDAKESYLQADHT